MKIPFDNLVEVEDNPESEYISVTYNGEPFTGTAYCESHRGYEEHSYLNGLPHGRSFIINPEGILVYEDFSENGETIEDTSWYPTGIKRSYVRQTPFLQQRWNEKAVLILQKTDTHHAEWYASGRKKS
ncbi:MAG: hypothetical protein FWG68_00695, partial [Defluviitaleaceae bacterium]|nr:hypothetical protein [Defluviitaleaceae bacterium]